MKFYYRIMGQHGTYVFTRKELERALDRENFGVKGEVLSEGNFAEVIDEWYQAELKEGIEACEGILKEPHAYGIQPETSEGRERYHMVEQDLEDMKRRLQSYPCGKSEMDAECPDCQDHFGECAKKSRAT